MNENTINILLVDDHELFAEGMVGLLNLKPEFKVIKTAKNGYKALNELESQDIDLVLLDIEMPSMNGIETATILLEKYPHIKVIILTMHNEKPYIQKMYQLGVHGYILKTCQLDELYFCIKQVTSGEMYYSSEITFTLINTEHNKKAYKTIQEELSDREKEILTWIYKGYNNQSIANNLYLSKHTISTHRKNIFRKLGVSNVAGMIQKATAMNILD